MGDVDGVTDPLFPPPTGDLQTVDGLLTLLALPGVGATKAVAIASQLGSWSALLATTDAAMAKIASPAAVAAVRDAPGVSTHMPPTDGVRVIGFFDEGYPEALRLIPQPPPVLWYRGSLPPAKVLAVVGTRQPTRFGVASTEAVTAAAVRSGFGVVSGLALGVDAIAHRSALNDGGQTWAVLGAGVDNPSPRSHHGLAVAVVESGGGLLSEVPPGTEPSPRTLVARNRLQAGLSRATIVTQCGIPSGTLHTARFTIEQGRLLGACRPHGRWAAEPESAGVMALTDPRGCDPAIFGVTGRAATHIAARRPCADVVLSDRLSLDVLWNRLSA